MTGRLQQHICVFHLVKRAASLCANDHDVMLLHRFLGARRCERLRRLFPLIRCDMDKPSLLHPIRNLLSDRKKTRNNNNNNSQPTNNQITSDSVL